MEVTVTVTAESNSQFLAFRRFIYNLSKKLSTDEVQAIVYIHFYDQKDLYQSATALEIFCKLESKGIITSSNPDKLVELMKDLRRNDLVSEVSHFLKKKKLKPKSSSLGRSQTSIVVDHGESENDLLLRNTIEAALVQSTVLLQQMELLQTAISGRKIDRNEVKEVVIEAAQTSEALAERLRKAEVRVSGGQETPKLSGAGSEELLGSDHRGYINTFRSGELQLAAG